MLTMSLWSLFSFFAATVTALTPLHPVSPRVLLPKVSPGENVIRGLLVSTRQNGPCCSDGGPFSKLFLLCHGLMLYLLSVKGAVIQGSFVFQMAVASMEISFAVSDAFMSDWPRSLSLMYNISRWWLLSPWVLYFLLVYLTHTHFSSSTEPTASQMVAVRTARFVALGPVSLPSPTRDLFPLPRLPALPLPA